MDKKIVLFQQFSNTAFLKANYSTIDTESIDGFVFELPFNHPQVGSIGIHFYNFNNFTIDYSSCLESMREYKSCTWNHVNKNFIILNARPGNQNWFNENWNNSIVQNFKTAAKIALELGLPGIMFDPEVYNGPVWEIANLPTYNAYTVAQHRIKATEVGYASGRAITAEYRDIRVFLTQPNLGFEGDPAAELYSYFLNGLIDGMNYRNYNIPENLLVGCENTYTAYNDNDFRFYDDQHFANFSHPDLTSNWGYRISKAYAVSPQGGGQSWDHFNFNNNYHTPASWQSVMSKALAWSGEYAWFYISNLDYFPSSDTSIPTHGTIDTAYKTALRNARIENNMRVW